MGTGSTCYSLMFDWVEGNKRKQFKYLAVDVTHSTFLECNKLNLKTNSNGDCESVYISASDKTCGDVYGRGLLFHLGISYEDATARLVIDYNSWDEILFFLYDGDGCWDSYFFFRFFIL